MTMEELNKEYNLKCGLLGDAITKITNLNSFVTQLNSEIAELQKKAAQAQKPAEATEEAKAE